MGRTKRKAESQLPPRPPPSQPRRYSNSTRSLSALVKIMPDIVVTSPPKTKRKEGSSMKVICLLCWVARRQCKIITLHTLVYESHLLRHHGIGDDKFQYQCKECSELFLDNRPCEKHITAKHKSTTVSAAMKRKGVEELKKVLLESESGGILHKFVGRNGIREMEADGVEATDCPCIYPPYIKPKYWNAFLAGEFDHKFSTPPPSGSVSGPSGQSSIEGDPSTPTGSSPSLPAPTNIEPDAPDASMEYEEFSAEDEQESFPAFTFNIDGQLPYLSQLEELQINVRTFTEGFSQESLLGSPAYSYDTVTGFADGQCGVASTIHDPSFPEPAYSWYAGFNSYAPNDLPLLGSTSEPLSRSNSLFDKYITGYEED